MYLAIMNTSPRNSVRVNFDSLGWRGTSLPRGARKEIQRRGAFFREGMVSNERINRMLYHSMNTSPMVNVITEQRCKRCTLIADKRKRSLPLGYLLCRVVTTLLYLYSSSFYRIPQHRKAQHLRR